MEKRRVSVGFIIGLVIVSVLMLAIIELNKSRLIGFIAVPILAVAFVLAFFVLVAISWPATKAVPAVDVANPERTDIIHLAQGDIRGVFNEDKTVEVYLYGNIPEDSDLYDDYDRKLSDAMKSYFINFATTGNPNGEGLPKWEQNLTSDNVLEFGDNFGMINEGEHELFALLDKMQGFTLD